MTNRPKIDSSGSNPELDSILLGLDPADLTESDHDEPFELHLVDGERCSSFELAAAMVQLTQLKPLDLPPDLNEKLKQDFQAYRTDV